MLILCEYVSSLRGSGKFGRINHLFLAVHSQSEFRNVGSFFAYHSTIHSCLKVAGNESGGEAVT
jgi:hypothetical protein